MTSVGIRVLEDHGMFLGLVISVRGEDGVSHTV